MRIRLKPDHNAKLRSQGGRHSATMQSDIFFMICMYFFRLLKRSNHLILYKACHHYSKSHTIRHSINRPVLENLTQLLVTSFSWFRGWERERERRTKENKNMVRSRLIGQELTSWWLLLHAMHAPGQILCPEENNLKCCPFPSQKLLQSSHSLSLWHASKSRYIRN